MVLYGVGTTVGAGIYALIGEISDVAGYLAPWAFLTAALLAAFTAYSYAQLSARYPKAAGAALYVQQGLKTPRLGQVVGLLVIAAGVISSAALVNGFVGYLQEFLPLGRIPAVVLASTLLFVVAAWGIAESVWIAGLISVIEVLGLLWITLLAGQATELSQVNWTVFVPEFSFATWSIVMTGALLAFYAYIGFEDMVEVAEEINEVATNLPRAILLTLGLSTLIYVLLVMSTILAVGPEVLAGADAPLSAVYRKLTGAEPVLISFIGLFAIINGALIQVIMASRVLYGLAARGQLPALLAWVHPKTRTPLPATVAAAATVLALALAGTLAGLAELTSVTMLVIFALVNWSLARLLWHESIGRAWIGLLGGVICAGFVARAIFEFFA